MERLDGKLQQIKVMSTRKISLQQLHTMIEEGEELLEDMRNMLERE